MTASAQHHVSLIGVVLGSVIIILSLSLAACINALCLLLFTRLLCRIALPFRAAFRLSVLLILLLCPIGIAGALLARATGGTAVWISALAWIANIIISSFIYGRIIKKPDHNPIGMRKGILLAISIAIIQFGISFLYAWMKHPGT